MATKRIGKEQGSQGASDDNASLVGSTSTSTSTMEEDAMVSIPAHPCFVPETGRNVLREGRFCGRCGTRLSAAIYGNRNDPEEKGGSSDDSSDNEIPHQCWENGQMGTLISPPTFCYRCGRLLIQARNACDWPECNWQGDDDDVVRHVLDNHS